MATVNQLFNSIDKSIKNARYRRTLILIERRARKYLNGFSGPEVKAGIKENAQHRYQRSMKLMSEVRKKLS